MHFLLSFVVWALVWWKLISPKLASNFGFLQFLGFWGGWMAFYLLTMALLVGFGVPSNSLYWTSFGGGGDYTPNGPLHH